MKTVCIDSRMISAPGIGTYLKNTLKRLDNKTIDIILIVSEKDLQKHTFLHNFKTIICNEKIYSIKEQLMLPRIIPKCDLFWSPHFNVPILPIKAKKRLVTIHDVFHLAFFSNFSIFEKIYAKIVYKAACLLSQTIITDSNFSKQEIIKYLKVKNEKIKVIHLGVDKELFTKETSKTIQHNLPNEYFLFVGSSKAHKNLENLLKAFKDFNHPTIKLVIVGKFDGFINKYNIKETVAEDTFYKNSVILLEDISDQDLSFVYQNALSFVFPSFYEGFGFPLIEAMSSKCPVIASTKASIPEVCEDNVLYINPHDIQDISNALKRISTDKLLREDLIKKGYERSQVFCWDKTVKKHIQVIKTLID
jgi:glycosyltransferase involved in cell wall biosynthesis